MEMGLMTRPDLANVPSPVFREIALKMNEVIDKYGDFEIRMIQENEELIFHPPLLSSLLTNHKMYEETCK